MGYTGAEIRAAIRRQQEIKRTQGEARMLRDGAVDYRVDATLFHNAIQQNRRVYGVQNCWAEKEFRDDMLRRHPEFKVKNVSRVLRFQGFGKKRSTGDEPAGKLTRFGRVTMHKSYA